MICQLLCSDFVHPPLLCISLWRHSRHRPAIPHTSKTDTINSPFPLPTKPAFDHDSASTPLSSTYAIYSFPSSTSVLWSVVAVAFFALSSRIRIRLRTLLSVVYIYGPWTLHLLRKSLSIVSPAYRSLDMHCCFVPCTLSRSPQMLFLLHLLV